jgi:hypothetical protein
MSRPKLFKNNGQKEVVARFAKNVGRIFIWIFAIGSLLEILLPGFISNFIDVQWFWIGSSLMVLIAVSLSAQKYKGEIPIIISTAPIFILNAAVRNPLLKTDTQIAALIYIAAFGFFVASQILNSDKDNLNLNREGKPYIHILHILIPYLILRIGLNFLYYGADEGSYAYEIGLINDGLIPYKDFVTRALPQIFTYYVFGKGFAFNLYTIKVVNALISTLTVLNVYLITKRVYTKNAALLSAMLLAIFPLGLFSQITTSTLIFETFLLSTGILFTIKFVQNSKYRSLLFAAFAFTLSFMVRATSGIYIAILGLFLFYLFLRPYKGRFLESLNWINIRVMILRTSFYLSGIVLAFAPFMAYLYLGGGVDTALQLFNPGGVLANEVLISIKYSLTLMQVAFVMGGIYVVSTCLYFVYYVKEKDPKFSNGTMWPILMTLIFPILIYTAYTFKRGFNIVYFTGLAVPLSIFTGIAIRRFSKLIPGTLNKVIIWSSLGLSLLAVFLVVPGRITPEYDVESGISLRRVVGSGFTVNDTMEGLEVIDHYTDDDDVILAGSLHWNNLSGNKQFMNLSRPMIYEGESTIYDLYDMPSRKQIRSEFKKGEVKLVVKDLHYDLAFSFLDDVVERDYEMVKRSDRYEVWVRR